MDYSLLTGIHNGVRGNSEGLREDKLSVFQVRLRSFVSQLEAGTDLAPSPPQPATVKVSRKPTQIKRDADASALRKAVQRSDPRALGGVHELPEQDTSERRLFLFYQDEGGMLATGDNNEDLGVIYYLVRLRLFCFLPYHRAELISLFFAGHHRHPHPLHRRQASRALLQGHEARQGPSFSSFPSHSSSLTRPLSHST